MSVLHYTDLWFALLNAQLDPAHRVVLNAHLRQTLGPVCPPVDDLFFRRHARFLQKLRDAWRQAQTQPAVLLLQPVVEICAPLLGKGPLDALLVPGLFRSPARARERDPLLQRAAVVGLASYLQCPDEPAALRRCEGLRGLDLEAPTWLDVHRFARTADPELCQRVLRSQTPQVMQRCPVIFRPRGRGSLCSRACRDRNVSLRRGLRDPDYAARRQRRYRQRRGRST